jgi:hypothetical protein
MKTTIGDKTWSPEGVPRANWCGALLGLVISAALAALPAYAQQSKSGGGALGPAAGSVGGGATGASNRGGAGGVSNPSPGGGPSNAGSPGQSAGPQGTETSRPGYLGGRTTEVEPPTPPPPPPGGTVTLAAYSVQQFGNCPVPGLQAAPQQRMSGGNGERVEAVAQYLNQGHRRDDSTARNLVANMQEELEKPQPDLTLVGTYLGIASRTQVTSTLVEDVSASLCAPVTGSAAQTIAEVAEAQREKLRAHHRSTRRTQ